MTNLAAKKCSACEGEVSSLQNKEIRKFLDELGGDWRAVHDHHLEKEYEFKDFAEALAFTNRVGEIAEKEGHHPDIHLSWGRVRVVLWTHKINGLTESDFILAAKIDQLAT